MNINHRILHHWEMTLLGAVAAACTVGVSLIAAGTLDRESIFLAMLFTAIGAIAKTPGKEPHKRNSGNPGFDDDL